MRTNLPATCPPHHPARLLNGALFIGRNRNLTQRLDALAAITAARAPRQLAHAPNIEAHAPHHGPDISEKAVR